MFSALHYGLFGIPVCDPESNEKRFVGKWRKILRSHVLYIFSSFAFLGFHRVFDARILLLVQATLSAKE